ncbi:putative oligosaccharyltransferase subunit ribophorin II [Paecilomyces variotii]|uniref:Putative oligosaccharyltransferase subunit ribophorin II n=1 Tax=Byssochlamys spectabilis TaxID=264951 RepID=A0A443I1S6_BYSSP|nr:putative oligosaccharyltransferase subunit ribophorin II [Paecilomyces variotii]KAJ9362269.1 hypothetical protein DTO280E4_3519 [Paecilomyces variotii]RWQ98022.1 putative oligosaccharyltransferase subunit ribophorin II [Paecilomyces variotii]
MRPSWDSMRLLLLASTFLPAYAATTWGFTDATVAVQAKGAGIGNEFKEKISENKPLSKPVSLGGSDTLKVALTVQEGGSAKRPHQAFLLLTDPNTGLDISYPFNVKETGKSKLELTQKDVPYQLLKSTQPIDASIVIGSFGSSKGYRGEAFKLAIDRDVNVPLPATGAPKYGKLAEIHHIFKPDPKNPPVIMTLVFVGAVLATLPVLAAIWIYLGANLNHLPAAVKSAPVPHALFVGSIVGLEGIFFLYYVSWNLFQMLPAAVAVGLVTFLSGSRALSEVYERRLKGLR